MIELHRKLLGDSVRNQAFHDALRKVIVPNQTTVADIGSGIGFLSFLARRLGAKECTLYEVADELELSKKLARLNGITNCKFVRAHSTEVKNPTKVDLVVCETLGNYAYEENIIETMNDARRFLKPGGTVMPLSVTQFVAPIVSSRLYDEINVWNSVGFDLQFDPAREITMQNMYVKTVRPDELLGAGKEWDSVDFSKSNASIREGKVEWKIGASSTGKVERRVGPKPEPMARFRAGAANPKIVGREHSCHEIFGFAAWWEAGLAPGIHLSTSPWTPPTHWEQIYLPVLNPVKLHPGETLTLTIRSDTRWAVKVNVRWEVRVIDARGKVRIAQKLDMSEGHLD